MLPLADVFDIEARMGREFDTDERVRVLALLDDASALVRDEAATTWIDPITSLLIAVPGSVRAVVLRAVERAVRNPQGFSAESAGDYSYQRTNVEPGVYLTDGERQIIRRAIGRTGLWTQPVTRGDEYLSTVWAEDQFGCELFPLDVHRD